MYKYVKAVAENEARVQAIGGSLKTAFTAAKMATNPGQAALPSRRAALLQGKRAGQVSRGGLNFLNWEGARHRPGGAWAVLIRAGSVVATIYVLWIGALAQITGNAALWLAFQFKSDFLSTFAAWARSYTANWHLDISIFIAVTFPIAFLTTTARRGRKRLAWTDVVLAALSFAVALYYIVLDDKFLHWSRGFSQPTTADILVGLRAPRPGDRAVPAQHRLGTHHPGRRAAASLPCSEAGCRVRCTTTTSASSTSSR